LFEFRNVLDVSYGAYVVNGAYHPVGTSSGSATETPSHEQPIAVIRELLRGNVAAIRQSAKDASTAISTIQYFADAIDTIAAKLTEMQALAAKAPSPDYSQVEVEDMQKQFENLAEQINQTVESTEYRYNKLFTADGRAVSISIGNGSKIDIFAKDFSFNAQGLNVATDPEGALSKVKQAIATLSEYREHLSRQVARVEEATAVIESKIEGAMGVDLSDFVPDVAVEVASDTTSRLLEDTPAALETQANVTPSRTLQVLKNPQQQPGSQRSNRQQTAGKRFQLDRPFQDDSHL